jgi:hypothetical protein
MACSIIRNSNNEIERVLAPNGQDSKLFNDISKDVLDKEQALRLWAQVYTDSFKNWFGNWENDPKNSSKVVDENGEPLIVYHGSENRIEEFQKQRPVDSRPNAPANVGIFTTPNRKYASVYTRREGTPGYLMPLFVNIRNIKDVLSVDERVTPTDVDGYLWNNMGLMEYVAFDPNQVKSVSNVGQFSTENNNIYQQSQEAPIPTVAAPKIMRLVNDFLRKAGFDIRKVNQVVVNGKQVDANAVVDVMNKLVQVVYGKEDTALPEEAMHVAVEMIEQQNPELFKSMLNKISNYDIYPRVYGTYSTNPFYQKDGKPNILKLKKEAMARVLVETIIAQNGDSAETEDTRKKVNDWWHAIKTWFKSLFTKHGNPFEEAVDMVKKAPGSTIDGTEVFLSTNPNQVSATMKVAQALRTDKMASIYKRFYATNKDKFYQELSALAPKEQVAILKGYNEEVKPTSLEDMITGVISQMSYVVEINEARDEDGDGGPAVHYNHLTVPGGIKYRENEIRTPSISPSIKGHAAFATAQGIGWFRSDDEGKVIPSGKFIYDGAGGMVTLGTNQTTGTRRILELQSDLFQKRKEGVLVPESTTSVRDLHGEILTSSNGKSYKVYSKTGELAIADENDIEVPREDVPADISSQINARVGTTIDNKANNFLNAIRDNWTRFFVQSIVQDSAKKGYTKVRFPSGETAANVEGHQTIANQVESINRKIEQLRNDLNKDGILWMRRADGTQNGQETTKTAVEEQIKSLEEQKQTLKTQGIEKLAPIEAFYENRVKNVLDKLYKGSVERVTDEHGNDWFEVTINQDHLGEFYFQINQDSQQDAYNKLMDTHNKMSLVENPDKPGESDYYIDGKKVKSRVSAKVNKYYNDKFRGKQISGSEEQEALNDQKKEKGTDGHKDMENMLHRLVDDNGFVRDEPLSQGGPSNLDPNDNTFYNTLWENMKERIASFPAGTRFMAEVMVHDKKEDEGGTMDFVAIEPNGKVNILDWKFINLKDGVEDIPWYKIGAWNVQLSEYKRILTQAYGIKRENFGQTRVIPIRTSYRFKHGTTDTLELAGVRIGNVNAKLITDDSVLPVNTRDETTGNKKLDQLIGNLYNLMDKIFETKSKPGEEYLKIERYNDLTSAVRQLHVKGATEDFLKFAYEDVKTRIYGALKPYFELADASNNADPIVAQDAKDKLNDLANVNQLAGEILNNEDTLELYTSINTVLRTVFDPFAEDNKAILQRAEEVVSNANIAKQKIEDLSNALRQNPIARGLGVYDMISPEISVSSYQKWFRSISQGATAAVDMLWQIVNGISNQSEIEFSEQVEILKKLNKDIDTFRQKTGKSWTDIKKMFLNINSKGTWNGKVISKVAQAFYTDIEKAKLNKDSAAVMAAIDLAAYQEWFKEELKNRQESYQGRRLFADEEADRLEKEKRILQFQKQFDIIGHPSTAINQGNKKLNGFPNMDKYTSEAYNLLQQAGNEPVLELYKYWQDRLEKSYKLGLVKAWEQKTFFPNVRKDLLDKYVFGSKDKKFKRTTLNFLDGISVHVDDEVFGYTDVNGNPQDKMGAMYMHDLGEKIIAEDGEEFTDYSNKSTDLFKVMALWNKEMIKFEHKSTVVDTARLLHLTEKNKEALGRSRISGRPAYKADGLPVIIENTENAAYYKSFLDFYFYGKKISEGQDLRFTIPINRVANKLNTFFGKDLIPLNSTDEVTISGKKLIQTVNRFFQMKTLGLNLSTALSNLFGGTANVIVNSGKYFTKKDILRGQMLMTSGKLWGSNTVYAALIDYFLPLTDDQTKEHADALSVNRAVRLLSSDHLFYLMRQSDKMVQYPAFIAFADNTMVQDGKLVNIREYVRDQNNYDNFYNLPVDQQQELTKKIEAEIEDLKEHRSLPKVSTVVDDKLVIPNVNRNSQTVFKLRNRVQQFAKDALGNMSQEDISLYRTAVIGQSFMMFKNWIPRMADVRFSETRYNPGTEDYEWGRVRMLFNALKYGILTGAKAAIGTLGGKNGGIIEIAKKSYEDKKREYEKTGRTFRMSEAQFIDNYIKGVRAQIKELAVLAAMMAGLFYAKSLAPDPEEDARSRGAYKWAVRMFDKMTDEIGFFYNPLSFTAIANGSIFPSVQILNDAVHLVTNMSLEGYYFVTGNDAAREKNKVAKYLFKSFPITKELTLYMALFNEELAKEYGVRITTESRRVY